jgi:GNAT superfamily N-acetyltransferase
MSEAGEWRSGEYVLTDDPTRLDLESVCALLKLTYWANNRPRSLIARSIQHSLCLALFYQGSQVGFSRAVTDHATFTWVCDVVVHPDHRGKGLGKWMVRTLLAHPELQTLSHHLCTKDAHTLYERFGFKRIEALRRGENPSEVTPHAPNADAI